MCYNEFLNNLQIFVIAFYCVNNDTAIAQKYNSYNSAWNNVVCSKNSTHDDSDFFKVVSEKLAGTLNLHIPEIIDANNLQSVYVYIGYWLYVCEHGRKFMPGVAVLSSYWDRSIIFHVH
jgi:hypothetical protein